MGLRGRRDVSVDFSFLAGKAFTGPLVEVRGQTNLEEMSLREISVKFLIF
jgi:hypothetical protein